MNLRLVTLCACLLFTLAPAPAQTSPKRPRINGLSNIGVYTSNPAADEHFYLSILGCAKAPDPEHPAGQRYYVNSTQFIEVLPLPPGKPVTSLDHTGYSTTNARALRVYLAAHGVTVPSKVKIGKDGSLWFKVKDPEGNVVEFVQNPVHPPPLQPANPIGRHMIHIGFLVHNSEKENDFYRKILGFRPYWFGGRREGEVNWISQQVPDGTDWLEYMLKPGRPGSSSSIPPAQLGSLDHFSLGVPDMAAATATLTSSNRLSPRHGGPQIGRDGKWQLNLFSPAGTRVELMEFKNVRPPCCSPFTAANPAP